MAKVSKRVFLDSEGNEFNSPPEGVAGVRHYFEGTDHVLDMPLEELTEDIILRNAAWGISTGVGNAYGGKSGDDAFEAGEARFETFKSGNWAAGRQVGPRDSDVLTALCEARPDLDKEDTRKRLAGEETEAGGPLDAKSVAGIPEVAVIVLRLQEERRAARQAKLEAAVKESDGSALGAI